MGSAVGEGLMAAAPGIQQYGAGIGAAQREADARAERAIDRADTKEWRQQQLEETQLAREAASSQFDKTFGLRKSAQTFEEKKHKDILAARKAEQEAQDRRIEEARNAGRVDAATNFENAKKLAAHKAGLQHKQMWMKTLDDIENAGLAHERQLAVMREGAMLQDRREWNARRAEMIKQLSLLRLGGEVSPEELGETADFILNQYSIFAAQATDAAVAGDTPGVNDAMARIKETAALVQDLASNDPVKVDAAIANIQKRIGHPSGQASTEEVAPPVLQNKQADGGGAGSFLGKGMGDLLGSDIKTSSARRNESIKLGVPPDSYSTAVRAAGSADPALVAAALNSEDPNERIEGADGWYMPHPTKRGAVVRMPGDEAILEFLSKKGWPMFDSSNRRQIEPSRADIRDYIRDLTTNPGLLKEDRRVWASGGAKLSGPTEEKWVEGMAKTFTHRHGRTSPPSRWIRSSWVGAP